MDQFQTNLSHPRTQPWADPSMLNINQGAPDYTFENHRADYGIVYDEGDINAQFADFDNDMDLDLAVASLYGTHYAKLYENIGGLYFEDVTYQAAINVEQAVSVVWMDVDEDGDEDLLVGGGGTDTRVRLYENRIGNQNHWVNLSLRGTTTNRDAVGARVTLTTGGVTQLREVWDGNGCNNTQKPRLVHFGLGSNTAIDSVTVHWVGGDTETFSGVGVDGTWTLVEGTGTAAR
jgi:hypothetical protein